MSGTFSTTGYTIKTAGYTGSSTADPAGSEPSNINITFGNNNKNIILNSTLLIPQSAPIDGTPVPFTATSRNANANIQLKDQYTGLFRKLYVDGGDMFIELADGSTPEFIRTDNLDTEINNLNNKVIFNNVFIQSGQPNIGYINFLQMPSPAISDLTISPNVGFRANNGIVQFKNTDTGWLNVGSGTETFIREQFLVTSTSNIGFPDGCVGIRIRAIGGGGQGGAANTSVYSQGGGGGSGGYAERFIRIENLVGSSPGFYCTVDEQYIDGRGGNVSVYYHQSIDEPNYIVALAQGGQPGTDADPTGYSQGGSGGLSELTLLPWETGVSVNTLGLVCQGMDGLAGFRSETQNLRYYSGGRGGDSMLGSGGRGLIPNDPALDQTTGRLGGGGGGGLYIPDAVLGYEVSESPQIASSGAVIIEFYVNTGTTSGSSSNGSGGGGVTLFRELGDTLVDLPNVAVKPYLKYLNSTGGYKINNIELDISDDTTPTLGGNLNCATHRIGFSADQGITSTTDFSNLIVAFSNPESLGANYMMFTKSNVSGTFIPTLTVDGQDTDISAYIKSKGDGDLKIDLNNGDMTLDARSLTFNSGSICSSIDERIDTDLSSNPAIPTTIQPTAGVLLFNISNNDTTYYTKMNRGLPGQNLTIIYEMTGTNSSVHMSFYDNTLSPSNVYVGVGTGLAQQLVFNTAGQSAALVYMEMFTGSSPHLYRNRWQVSTTGCLTLG